MHEELPSLDPNYFRCLRERWRTWSVAVAVSVHQTIVYRVAEEHTYATVDMCDTGTNRS